MCSAGREGEVGDFGLPGVVAHTFCRPADIAMMQSADFGNRDGLAEFRRLNWSSVGCILVEQEVSACPVIVREVADQDSAQVAFAQNEDMIKILEPDRADEPLRDGDSATDWGARPVGGEGDRSASCAPGGVLAGTASRSEAVESANHD